MIKWELRLIQVINIWDHYNDAKRYKARMVVKGIQQLEGIDFTEIFSHVMKLTTSRSVLNILTAEDLHLK